MGEKLSVRQAEPGDAQALSRIERASFDAPWSEAEIARDISAGGRVYVAVSLSGEERTGYADMRIVADEAQLYNLAVAPGFRRMGAGEALMRHLKDTARSLGCRLMTLEVRAGNEAALRLYEKLGFREVGRRPGYYAEGGEDAVLMDMDLWETEAEAKL